MARLIKNILIGMRDVLVLWPGTDYVHPSKQGFKTDAKTLREDANRITRELRKQTLEHGKQAYIR